jgi:hypothetical protein
MKPATLALSLVALASAGCSSYVNSRAVQEGIASRQQNFTHPIVARAYNARPAMHFPATISVVAEQQDARNHLRAFDAAGRLDRLKGLPQLSNVVLQTTLLGNSDVNGSERKAGWDLAARESAARMHADAVLLIGMDTFTTDGDVIAPLTVLSLGLMPNHRYQIVSTAMGALVDVRTGYVYGTLERSAAKGGVTMSWGESDVVGRATRKAEAAALEKLLGEFPNFWQGVVKTHAR